MKKYFTALTVIFILAFVGSAFAAGHVDPGYKPVVVTSEDVAVATTGVTTVSVKSVESAEATSDAGKINADVKILGGLALDLSGDKTGKVVNITLSNVSISGNPTFAYISKGTSFVSYSAAKSGTTIVIKSVPLADHFSEAKIYFAEPTSSGGSSGGCNAGFAGLLLLAAAPLCFFRKK